MKKKMLYLFKCQIISMVFLAIPGCWCYVNKGILQKKVKPLKYLGIVDKKFLDSSDRMSPKVQFQDGSVIYMDAYEMYLEIQYGDTVIKNVGSLKFILKRNGETKTFYPKCDGKEIK